MSGIVLTDAYNPSGPLVFLDMDGVLNGHDYNNFAKSSTILRGAVANLNRVLIETGAKIVLSSAWRYMLIGKAMSLRGFDYLLRTHGVVADRLIGATCADETRIAGPFIPILVTALSVRGWQIQAWRRARGHRGPYAVIDDMDLCISSLHEGHFVQTSGEIGLTDSDADAAIAILAS